MDEVDEQELLYRIQLLQAFNIAQWNDDEINDTLMTVFRQVYFIPGFIELLEVARATPSIKSLLDILCPEHDHPVDLTSTMVLFCQEGAKVDAEADSNAFAEAFAEAFANQKLYNIHHLTVFKLLFKFEYFDVLHYCLGAMLRQGVLPANQVAAMTKTLQAETGQI